MKTNRSARWIVKSRSIMFCLAFVGMVGVAFYLGESLAARVVQTSAPQTEAPPIPQASLVDLMAAAR